MKVFSIYVIAYTLAVAGPLLARSDDDRDGHEHRHKKRGQCNRLVLDWSDWGPCTVPCEGVGLQFRARQEVQSQLCYSREVPCPIAGTWGDWTEVWSCSASCGPGTEVDERTCNGLQQGGNPCVDSDGNEASTETRTVTCDFGSCPVDGTWGEWTEVDSCSATCGPGTEVDERTCTGPQHGGNPCLDIDENEASTETRTVTCELESCPDVCASASTPDCQPCESISPASDVFCRVKSHRFASRVGVDPSITVYPKIASVLSEDDCIQACVNSDKCIAFAFIYVYPVGECLLYSSYAFALSGFGLTILDAVEQVSSDEDVRLYIGKEELPEQTCGHTCPDEWLEFDPAILTTDSDGYLYAYGIGGDFCRADGYQLDTIFSQGTEQNGETVDSCIQICAGSIYCRLVYADDMICKVYYEARADSPDVIADVIPSDRAGAVLMIRKEEFDCYFCPPAPIPGCAPEWTLVTP